MKHTVDGQVYEVSGITVTALTFNFLGAPTIFYRGTSQWNWELELVAEEIDRWLYALDIDEKAEYWEPPAQLEPRDDPAY